MAKMLFMVIERFKNQDAQAVYKRFQEQGRMMPDGLKYIDSWVEASFNRCFQLMECDDPVLFQQWIAKWQDLMEFEIVPVVPSAEAKKSITSI
ncbi:MAG TPA: DUF3303 family protein [Pyrinomonadaceae bacterium]|jgi:hypothetical protein